MNLKNILPMTVCLLTAISMPAYTQENITDVRKQIRDIKLSEQYIYADAMSSTSFDEARLMAMEELRIAIAGLLAEQQKNKTEIEEKLGQMEHTCKTLQYNNMNHFKAFVYIPTASLSPQETAITDTSTTEPAVVSPSPIIQPITDIDTTAVTQIADIPEPATPPTSPVNQQPVTNAEPAESDFAMDDAQTESLAKKTTEAIATTPTAPISETKPAEQAEPVAPITTPPTEAADADTLQTDIDLPLPDSHQRVLDDLLALDTYESVMLYLDVMKDDGRLMYGRISTLVSAQEAYLIIVKDGQLLTILDRGTGERTNLRTRKPDNIRNYKGHAVIWLKVFK